jgi:hypothetical protein
MNERADDFDDEDDELGEVGMVIQHLALLHVSISPGKFFSAVEKWKDFRIFNIGQGNHFGYA